LNTGQWWLRNCSSPVLELADQALQRFWRLVERYLEYGSHMRLKRHMKRFLIANMGVFFAWGQPCLSIDVLPYLSPARLSRAGAATPRLSCPYLAPSSPRAAELFFDARRCRRGRGTWALLFLASRLLWFAPTVSVGHRDPVTRANVSSGIWLSSISA
jgi:hypothetical protein